MSTFPDLVLMTHVGFGMACIVAGVWVFVDLLNASQENLARIRNVSLATAVFMWLAYLVGGYWYLVYYAADKAVILKGPWPFAHNFFMEMKEHVLIMLLLLTTFLPIVASNNIAINKAARRVMLCVVGLVVLIGFAMDGSGAIISIGAKLGLMKG